MTQSIIVIGGGPVGAVAAYLLAKRGLTVYLVKRSSKSNDKAGETFPPAANRLLQQLGLQTLLEQGGHLRCPGNQSTFGSTELMDVDFIYSPNGLGWHLDRRHFEEQLLTLARDQGVNIINNHHVRDIQRKRGHWHLALQPEQTSASANAQKHTLTGDYLIDASGVARVLLRQQRIEIQHHDQLAARIGVFQTDTPIRDHRTLVEATQDGWWYSSSTPNNKRIVMFFSDADQRAFKLKNKAPSFMAGVKTTNFIMKKLQSECSDSDWNTRLTFFTEPAHSSRAHCIQGDHWCAIGDAAMTFDPLSSQGLWTGFESARKAADMIVKKNEGVHTDEYSRWSEALYQDYLAEKKKFYSMEKRWRNSVFWQRRAPTDSPIAA